MGTRKPNTILQGKRKPNTILMGKRKLNTILMETETFHVQQHTQHTNFVPTISSSLNSEKDPFDGREIAVVFLK